MVDERHRYRHSPTREQLTTLLAQFPASEYGKSEEDAFDAFNRRLSFNIVDYATFWKIDFILRQFTPFDASRFTRCRFKGRTSIVTTSSGGWHSRLTSVWTWFGPLVTIRAVQKRVQERSVRKSAVVVCLVAMLSVNCGSIVHQTTQQVRVNSEPAGAAVTVACGDVNNDPKLVTPAVVTLHRKPAYCGIKLNKEGFAEKELKFGRQMSGWYLGNIIFGGIIGLIVDAANGAMWTRTTPTNAQKEAGEVKTALEPTSNDATGTK